jgi:ubiquinone/menaquinone biosynthesis C-methylase UbiE
MSPNPDLPLTLMGTRVDAGLHTAPGRPIDVAGYEQYIGRWSRLFVPALLAAAEVAAGCRVLDVAAGPGEAALAAASVVTSGGLIVGADVSPAMLKAARGRPGGGSLVMLAADGQELPFKESAFDAVVCQLGLQCFPDPGRGLLEFRRVLRPAGRAAICVVSTADRAPTWGVLADALSRHLPAHRDRLHLPFALADAERLERMLVGTGFQDVRVRRETRSVTFESFGAYWASIEAGTGTMPQAYLSLPGSARRAVRDEVRTRLAEFESGGRIVTTVEMLIGAGRA